MTPDDSHPPFGQQDIPQRISRHPTWINNGGVSTLDSGLYQESVTALRRGRVLTDVQRTQVINVIMEARRAGADMSYLDPTAPTNVRDRAFAEILRPAIERGEISDMSLADTTTLRQLYNDTLSWGEEVQKLLDDPGVTEVKIIGCTVHASSARGLIVLEHAYESIAEPMSRVTALAQLLGITWDKANPSVTLPLPHKTRLHATRDPLVAEGDLLIVIRRGRQRPWEIADLVSRQALDAPAAQILRQLVQGSLSVIVSGPQDSGKTTLLECLLNALPADRHVVLVEDATDEFTLKGRAVSRLQVGGSGGAAAFDTVVRETLRMTPDVLGPGEMRGGEAGAVAQIGEAGRPTMTTIHARSPQAAVRRFARLAAADIPGNSFARQRDAAMEVIAESFHLVIHMQHSQRVQRRIMQSVVLLNGLDTHGQPVCIPLIESHYDDAAIGGVTWTCAARIVGDTLVWDNDTITTPESIQVLLQDSLAAHRLTQPHAVAAGNQVAGLLGRARELLSYPDQADQVIPLLEQLLRLDPDLRDVWPLADRLLSNNQALRHNLEQEAEGHIAVLTAHVTRRDVAAATSYTAAATHHILQRMVLNRNEAWNAQQHRIAEIHTQSMRVPEALAEAHALATHHGDLSGALQVLTAFDVRLLTVPDGLALLEARHGLLRGQMQRLGPNQQAVAQRRQNQLDLVARDKVDIAALAPEGMPPVTQVRAEPTRTVPPTDEAAPRDAAAPAEQQSDVPVMRHPVPADALATRDAALWRAAAEPPPAEQGLGDGGQSTVAQAATPAAQAAGRDGAWPDEHRAANAQSTAESPPTTAQNEPALDLGWLAEQAVNYVPDAFAVNAYESPSIPDAAGQPSPVRPPGAAAGEEAPYATASSVFPKGDLPIQTDSADDVGGDTWRQMWDHAWHERNTPVE